MHDLYEQCLCIARITAKEYGYAIGLHGTGQRDLDLIAVPWAEQACAPDVLVENIARAIRHETKRGHAIHHNGDITAENEWPKPMLRPHGRLSFTIILGGPYFIDISVMPPISGTELIQVSRTNFAELKAALDPEAKKAFENKGTYRKDPEKTQTGDVLNGWLVGEPLS